MKDFSFKGINADNSPIYLYGAFSGLSIFVLDWLEKHNGKLTAVFDQNFSFGYNTDKYSDYMKRYEKLQLRVSPPPNDILKLPSGVVIIAVGERNQRECQAKWSIDKKHNVIDVFDIINYPIYLNCLENKESPDLLSKCASCSPAGRHCPVRSEWYEKQTGNKREKVINHIAIKAGFICNLKCAYCCEFIPRFPDKFKRPFNSDALMEDIWKLSESLEYIRCLSFSGGDVMLNRGLGNIIEKTAKIGNIGDIYCLTNGTYTPHSDVLDAIQNTNGKARIIINNYERNNKAVPLINELNRRKIHNVLRDNAGWYDLNELSFKNRSINELKKLYAKCTFDNNGSKYYHIMTDGKINMRCGVANGILYCLDKYDECNQDFIDIRNLSLGEIPDALTTLENKNYLDICNYCSSGSIENRTLVAAGEQL